MIKVKSNKGEVKVECKGNGLELITDILLAVKACRETMLQDYPEDKRENAKKLIDELLEKGVGAIVKDKSITTIF